MKQNGGFLRKGEMLFLFRVEHIQSGETSLLITFKSVRFRTEMYNTMAFFFVLVDLSVLLPSFSSFFYTILVSYYCRMYYFKYMSCSLFLALDYSFDI